MKKVLQHIWYGWVAFWIAAPFVIMFPLFFITLKIKELHPLAHRLRRFWARLVLLGPLMPWKIEYEEPLEKSKAYIIAPNHFSYLDIPTITIAIPGFFNFMAKRELEKIPLFGTFFHSLDIAVHRQNPIAANKALERAKRQLINERHGIVIFPEGTVSRTPPKMQRFKDGPFKLAIETGTPILPVSLQDNYIRLPDDKTFRASPGWLRVYVHKPVSVSGLTLNDLESLKQKVYDIINSKLRPE